MTCGQYTLRRCCCRRQKQGFRITNDSPDEILRFAILGNDETKFDVWQYCNSPLCKYYIVYIFIFLVILFGFEL